VPGACTCPFPMASAVICYWFFYGLDSCLKDIWANGFCCDSIDDINKSCLEQFRAHWQCLDNNNHQLWQCRPAEWKLNRCVFDNLVSAFPVLGELSYVKRPFLPPVTVY
jgi:hypothetical protein